MTIELRVSFGYEPGENIPEFYQRRKRFLSEIADHFRTFEPVFEDVFLIFRGLTPGERRIIESYCSSVYPTSDLYPKAVYTREEIEDSTYVPLLVKGDEIDHGVHHLNEYRRQCTACGTCDLHGVPHPLVIESPRRKSAIFKAMNGIRIISVTLWHELKEVLHEWVNVGPVAFADSVRIPSQDLLWMMPRHAIGPSVSAVTLNTCVACGSPTEIRVGDPSDLLMRSVEAVTDFRQLQAPIALLGNWYGSIHPDTPPDVHWPIVISGDLHKRFRKMKVRGFVPADSVIHPASDLPAILGT